MKVLGLASLALLVAGCATELPPIDATAFSCDSDQPTEGLLQCPTSHRCAMGGCTPRLGCIEPDATEPGCTPNTHRCDLVSSPDVSGTACINGLHTETSSAVRDLDACDCADGLHCVALAEVTTASTPSALPLYVIPRELRPAQLPASALGAAGERVRARVCTRVCSSEIDCPSAHTCRAAAVLHPSTIAGSDLGRHTIGVCQPDLLVTTSTPSEQADPTVCRSRSDCTTRLGKLTGECVVRVDTVDDHPTRPAGEAWSGRRAVVPHCAGSAPSGSVRDGDGCTEDAVCASGECEGGRCQTLCDPRQVRPCADARTCRDSVVQHRLPGGQILLDRLFLCD